MQCLVYYNETGKEAFFVFFVGGGKSKQERMCMGDVAAGQTCTGLGGEWVGVGGYLRVASKGFHQVLAASKETERHALYTMHSALE
jgi:hypothetical protein